MLRFIGGRKGRRGRGRGSSHADDTTRFTEIGLLWKNWAARSDGLNPVVLGNMETQCQLRICQVGVGNLPRASSR